MGVRGWGPEEKGIERPLIGSGPSVAHFPALWDVGSEAGAVARWVPPKHISAFTS